MRVIAFESFGGVEVLKKMDMPDPRPGPGEVRIRVAAAGVNPVDAKIRKGYLQSRIPHQFPLIPGWDAAGVIDEVGAGVSSLAKGDEVYAYCRKPVVQFGTYADYVVVPETSVARKPAKASMLEAAAIPLAALTAWQSLFDAAGLGAGQTVLIHAGAGGVGGYAIQLAKVRGAKVIATGSGRNHAYIKSLGADHVIDYTLEDFRIKVRQLCPGGVDVAYDTVGGDIQSKSADVIRKGGVLVSILAYENEESIKQRGIQTRYVFVSPNALQLSELAALYDSGKLRVKIASEWPLDRAAEAHRLIETGHTTGKIVLKISA